MSDKTLDLQLQVCHSPAWYQLLSKAEMFSLKIENVGPEDLIQASRLTNTTLSPDFNLITRGYFEFPRLLANKITYNEYHLTDMMLQSIEWALGILGHSSDVDSGHLIATRRLCSSFWRLPSDQRIEDEVRYRSDSWIWRNENLERFSEVATLIGRRVITSNTLPNFQQLLLSCTFRAMERGYFPYSVIDHVYQAIRSQNVSH